MFRKTEPQCIKFMLQGALDVWGGPLLLVTWPGAEVTWASTSHLYVPCVRSTPSPAWREERRGIKSTKEAAERALRWIWGKKVWKVGQCCWDTRQVLINLGWDFERPKTPDDLRNITEDVSPAQSGMYLHTIFFQLKIFPVKNVWGFMTSNISKMYQSGFRKNHSTERDTWLWMAANFAQLFILSHMSGKHHWKNIARKQFLCQVVSLWSQHSDA